MLKKGFLSTNIIFTSTAHTERLINKYISNSMGFSKIYQILKMELILMNT